MCSSAIRRQPSKGERGRTDAGQSPSSAVEPCGRIERRVGRRRRRRRRRARAVAAAACRVDEFADGRDRAEEREQLVRRLPVRVHLLGEVRVAGVARRAERERLLRFLLHLLHRQAHDAACGRADAALRELRAELRHANCAACTSEGALDVDHPLDDHGRVHPAADAQLAQHGARARDVDLLHLGRGGLAGRRRRFVVGEL